MRNRHRKGNDIALFRNITNMDNKFQIGLTSIERGDYYKVSPEMTSKLGTHVVVDNTTKLRGLVSDDSEEICRVFSTRSM
jgi:hypothetical protein